MGTPNTLTSPASSRAASRTASRATVIRPPDRPEAVRPAGIRRIGVVGAGRMGSGIAEVCARAGYDVLLSDIDGETLRTATTAIARNLESRPSNSVAAETMGRLVAVAGDLSPFAEADLVIEAGPEDETTKRAIFAALAPHLKAGALIATNTSSLSITRLAAASGRPARFIGMHFMNPVAAMGLVELIRGLATDDETFATMRDVALSIGKSIAVADDFPAFIVHRILMPMINEAVYTLYEGVGTVRDIDMALKLGANHRMGPLELADFIGLDLCLSMMQALHQGLDDGKYRPCPLLVKYVEAGWIGRKVGRGFYDYSQTPPAPSR